MPATRSCVTAYPHGSRSCVLVDFVVSRNRLAHLRRRVLIPIVFATVSNEDRALLFDFLDQFAPLHASSSSECWRTFGITPEDKSL